MKKIAWRALAALLIVLALYHLVVFFIPGLYESELFWVSYGFTMAALVVAWIGLYMSMINKPDAKSQFYGFPIARICILYLGAQTLLGLVFMLLGDWIPLWLAVIVYAVGLGAACLGLIAADSVKEEVERLDVKIKTDVALMRRLQSKVYQMVAQCEDPEAKKALQDLSEELRYSDPVSHPDLAEAEAELAAAIDDLQGAVVDGDYPAIGQLCCHTAGVLFERNRQCKLTKG